MEPRTPVDEIIDVVNPKDPQPLLQVLTTLIGADPQAPVEIQRDVINNAIVNQTNPPSENPKQTDID